MAPFYGWGSTASRLEPLRGGSFEHGTPGLGIQRLNHLASAVKGFKIIHSNNTLKGFKICDCILLISKQPFMLHIL